MSASRLKTATSSRHTNPGLAAGRNTDGLTKAGLHVTAGWTDTFVNTNWLCFNHKHFSLLLVYTVYKVVILMKRHFLAFTLNNTEVFK